MILHTMLGTNDLDKAEAFYDELLSELNGKKLFKTERGIFYDFGEGNARLAIGKPFDDQAATSGNGTMVAFAAPDANSVNRIYEKVLSLGGTSEGEPGERAGGKAYGAYFRDLDGNKFGLFYLMDG